MTEPSREIRAVVASILLQARQLKVQIENTIPIREVLPRRWWEPLGATGTQLAALIRDLSSPEIAGRLDRISAGTLSLERTVSATPGVEVWIDGGGWYWHLRGPEREVDAVKAPDGRIWVEDDLARLIGRISRVGL